MSSCKDFEWFQGQFTRSDEGGPRWLIKVDEVDVRVSQIQMAVCTHVYLYVLVCTCMYLYVVLYVSLLITKASQRLSEVVPCERSEIRGCGG